MNYIGFVYYRMRTSVGKVLLDFFVKDIARPVRQSNREMELLGSGGYH